MACYYNEIRFIEFLAGTELEDACRTALELALRKDIIVKFNFNGVEMKVYPLAEWENFEDEVKSLVKNYDRRIHTKGV